jgi:hypothetical protein
MPTVVTIPEHVALQILHSLPFFANVPEPLFDRVLQAGQLIMYTAGRH